MSDRQNAVPPANMTGITRGGRGVFVKPKDFRGTLRRLWDLTRGKRNGLGWILLLSALASAASILSPYLSGRAVTAIKDGSPVRFLLIMLLLLYFADWLVKLLQKLLMATVGQRVIHHIRNTLFDRMIRLPLAFFDGHRHGELMSRLTNDIDNISTTISNSLTMLMTYAFTIVGILMIMLFLSPLLTLVACVSIVLIVFLTRFITKRTRKMYAEQQKDLGVLNAQIEEGISGLNVVKAFCHEQEMEKIFTEKNDRLTATAIRALIMSGYLMPLMNVINNLSYAAIAVFSGVMYVKGQIADIGLITSFLLYVRQFTRPFVEIANIYNSFQTAVAGAERVFDIMDRETEPEDRPDSLPFTDPDGAVEFRHVRFGYTPEKEVLKDISLTVPAGTRMAIVGSTGSGKTTLINLLTRFYDVTGGEILLDGHNITDYRMHDLREAFGVVLQDTNLFAATVLENIAYGDPDAPREKIEEAARLVGADTFIRRLPHGYDTVLEQGGAELSQGERQLLTIARAVLADSPIMILDEATSSVDTVTEQKIHHAMLEMCRGRTSFIIAHRLSTIRDSDEIVLLEDGRIAEMGTHDELMALGGRYAGMYLTQTGACVSD